jgi:steroid delta-isomerase
MVDRSELKANADAYLDGLSRNDAAAIIALFAPDARVEDPIGSAPRIGLEAITAFYSVPRAISSVTRIGPLTVNGNFVGFQFRVRIEGQRSFGPERTPGVPLELSITEILHFDDDGKIISMVAVPDFDSGPETTEGRSFTPAAARTNG